MPEKKTLQRLTSPTEAPPRSAPRKAQQRLGTPTLPPKPPKPKAPPKRKPRVRTERAPEPQISVSEALERTEEIFDVEIVDPSYEAYKWKLTGLDWVGVARKSGFETAGAARNAVEAWLTRAVAEQAAERRAMAMEFSVARHETLIEAYWEKAIKEHDVSAAAVVSRELGALDKVQRLGEKDIEGVGTQRTIVVAGTPEEYIEGLKAIATAKTKSIEGRGGKVIEG